ncbi:hypothetical protein KUV80_16820 [Fictibacillus nanhaiensis]|uniref:hypothetical protein n=1 Tax=Fictibacillus nanhaiensis TaxID=742169 RepID=UPI001C97DFFB|nr:hypothetical protein [Fictibacillus nanhaiensis]MBY6038312.1 hypothetical protein [Fictibacillus nanhaiensis]
MKKVWGMMVILSLYLAGCSDNEKEQEFTIKDAIEENHVVIQNNAEKFEDLMDGGTKAEHLAPMFTFLEDVKADKESKLQMTVFPKTGEPTTSEVHYISKDKTIFKNKNKTYGMPTGDIECMYIFDSNASFMLDGCKGQISTVLVIPFSTKEYNLARNEYRKLNKE